MARDSRPRVSKSKPKSKPKPKKKTTAASSPPKRKAASLSTIETSYPTFFQGYRLQRTAASLETYYFDFHSTVQIFGTLRATTGGLVGKVKASANAGIVRLVMKTQFLANADLLLYLFTSSTDNDNYASACTTFTAPEQDLANSRYLPDVPLTPQQAVRTQRDAYPNPPSSNWATLSGKLIAVYSTFVTYQPGITPALDNAGIPHNLIVAAPGNPPEWYPP